MQSRAKESSLHLLSTTDYRLCSAMSNLRPHTTHSMLRAKALAKGQHNGEYVGGRRLGGRNRIGGGGKCSIPPTGGRNVRCDQPACRCYHGSDLHSFVLRNRGYIVSGRPAFDSRPKVGMRLSDAADAAVVPTVGRNASVRSSGPLWARSSCCRFVVCRRGVPIRVYVCFDIVF